MNTRTRCVAAIATGLLAGVAVADEPVSCPIPDPPGVPSVAVPGIGVESLLAIATESLAQDPWVIAHVDSNNVSVRRPLDNDSVMRQGWEDIHGAPKDALFFDEMRWTFEPRIEETVVTVRDYLVVLGPDAEEQWFEYKSDDWMIDIQCTLEKIRQVVLENEVVPARENSL